MRRMLLFRARCPRKIKKKIKKYMCKHGLWKTWWYLERTKYRLGFTVDYTGVIPAQRTNYKYLYYMLRITENHRFYSEKTLNYEPIL